MFETISEELSQLIKQWTAKFLALQEQKITLVRNTQKRNIKQIVGHMIDSASNNTHRVVHLQYEKLPLEFPNYATYGNNDRWIAIQNYEKENWENLVFLWKYSNLHYLHVIKNINPEELGNEWMADKNEKITLKEMIEDFPRHFKLHISEIEELLNC